MKRLRPLMLLTDVGFIVYWLITLFGLIPPEYLFNDYTNPVLTAWNWSFLPLDLAISFTGLWAVRRHRAGLPWRELAIVSLALTFASGLQAIAFWTIRGEFDPVWWTPNLFLLIYPLFFLPGLLRAASSASSSQLRSSSGSSSAAAGSS